MKNVQERFQDAIALLKGKRVVRSNQNIIDAMGVNKSSFSSAYNGHKNYLTEEFVKKFVETYPNHGFTFETIWRGGDFKEPSEIKPIPYDNYMMVEYADLSTAAGKLGGENPTVLPDRKRRLVPKEFDNGNYLVVGVDGDSMDNGTNISIPDGTEILIKEHVLHNGDKLPIRGNLFVIVTTEGTVFKQIVEHNTVDGYIVCHSYNEKYSDFTIHMDDILQVFIYRKIVSFRPTIPEIK